MEKRLTSDSSNIAVRVLRFYYDGFMQMTSLGRTLWLMILIKLFIFFVILKLFFFPNILQRDYDNDEERAQAVRSTLVNPERYK